MNTAGLPRNPALVIRCWATSAFSISKLAATCAFSHTQASCVTLPLHHTRCSFLVIGYGEPKFKSRNLGVRESGFFGRQIAKFQSDDKPYLGADLVRDDSDKA